MNIEIKESGTGAHCAIFTDNWGHKRQVFTLNGERAANLAALARMGIKKDDNTITKAFIQISDILKFGRLLTARRNKNKLANKSRAKNRK